MSDVRSVRIEIEVTLPATRRRVFTALTSGVGQWWGKPYLENERAVDLEFEAKLGGHFFEKWGTGLDDQDVGGAIIGTVVAIQPPEYLRLTGDFGITDRMAKSVLTIRLTEADQSTHLKLTHDILGVIDDAVRDEYRAAWHALLARLGVFMQKGHGQGIRAEFHVG